MLTSISARSSVGAHVYAGSNQSLLLRRWVQLWPHDEIRNFKAGSWKKSAPAQTSKTTTPLPDRVGRCWIRVASFTSLIHSAALVFLALQRTLSHIEDCLPMFNVADMSIGLVAIYNSKYCIGCDSHFNTTTWVHRSMSPESLWTWNLSIVHIFLLDASQFPSVVQILSR